MRRALAFAAAGFVSVLAIALGLGVLAYSAVAGPEPLAVAARTGLVLEDVVLVEPGVGRRSGRRLVVEGARIASVTPIVGGEADEVPRPWAGAYVLPGLIDAHAHLPPAFLPGQSELFAFAFLAHGVTGVRVPGDASPGASPAARDAVAAGRLAGPRIATCGRFIDGPGAIFASAIVVETAEEARAAVDEIARSGFDCVKAYNELDADTMDAIHAAADAHGLPVIGHVPWRLDLETARLDDVQHMFGFHRRDSADSFGSLDARLAVDEARVDAVAALLLEQGAAMTTSIVAHDRISRSRDIARDPDDVMRRWLPPFYADAIWAIPGGINPGNLLDLGTLAKLQRVAKQTVAMVPRLHRAGVSLRLGTDTFAPPVVPGASLHAELDLIVEAGLSPEEALSIATRGGAGALPVEGLGALRPGAPADFVVYAEDPTRDLAALESLLAVVADGRVYPRATLDAQLERYRRHWDGLAMRAVAVPMMRTALRLALRSAAGLTAEADRSKAEAGDGA